MSAMLEHTSQMEALIDVFGNDLLSVAFAPDPFVGRRSYPEERHERMVRFAGLW